MGKSQNSFIRWCRRYISLTALLVAGLCAYVVFFNDNSFIKVRSYDEQINMLNEEIKENQDTLDYYNNLNRRLDTDRVTMERIVREQYHMQRTNEDVYICE